MQGQRLDAVQLPARIRRPGRLGQLRRYWQVAGDFSFGQVLTLESSVMAEGLGYNNQTDQGVVPHYLVEIRFLVSICCVGAEFELRHPP